MTHHFADLGTAADRSARARFVDEATQRWREGLASAAAAGSFRFCEGVWAERFEKSWAVRWEDPSLRPLAHSVLDSAPSGESVILGLPSRGWESAVEWVARTHRVNLSSAEVRVGITRGHLLALVFSIPFDVSGGPELLQTAVEAFCERALGEQLLDRWVVSIDVVRSARRSKLAVLASTTERSAETHPLPLLLELVDRGIRGVLAGLPESRLGACSDGWTALELEPGGAGPQAERLSVYTNVPEALKAALEGLPFDSARFALAGEVLIWVAWSASPLTARIAARETAEATLTQAMETGSACVCGSGFGPTKDYLDLWAVPKPEVLGAIVTQLASRLGVPIELGFYDSHWSRELLAPIAATAG